MSEEACGRGGGTGRILKMTCDKIQGIEYSLECLIHILNPQKDLHIVHLIQPPFMRVI